MSISDSITQKPIYRILSFAALAALASGSTVAFSAASHRSPTTNKVVHLVYWAGHASGALHAAVVEEVKMFNQSHPNIQVTFHDEGASTHGLAAFEAGKAPNVGMISGYIVPQLTQAGAILNLKPYVHGPAGLTTQEIRKRYYPVVWRDMQSNSGKQYLMPLEKKSLLVIYDNESLFKRAGIKSAPTTWSEVGQDARRIAQLGKGYYGIAWTPALRQFFDVTLSDGGKVFATATHRTQFSLDNPGANRALTMLRTWIADKSMIMTTGYQYQLDFGTGKVGMVIDASAGYTYDKGSVGGKFVMGGISAPKGTSGQSSQYINGASLAMFNVGTQAQKQASWTFIKWLSSPAVNVYWNEHTNYLPLGPADYALMKPFYSQHPAEAASFSNPQTWWFKPRSANYQAAENAVQVVLEKALRGQLSVASALKQMTTVGTNYLSGKVKG